MTGSTYFSHDSNAKDDPKCIMLIEQLGPEGYGIYWILIELLREQPEFKCHLTTIPALARRYLTTKEKVEAVIKNYGLFRLVDEEFFLSESLCKRMSIMETKRKALSQAGKKGNAARWRKQDDPSPGDNKAIATQSQIKEKKVKEIYKYSLFYDSELNQSEQNQDYEKFINILFGQNSENRKLDSVIRMPQQLTFEQFKQLMYYKKQYRIQIGEILLDMDNYIDLKKRKSLLRTFKTFMNNRYPETKKK